MTRLSSIVVKGLTVASAVLCAAVCVLWAHSYARADYVTRSGIRPQGQEVRFSEIMVQSRKGTVVAMFNEQRYTVSLEKLSEIFPRGWLLESFELDEAPLGAMTGWGGFGFHAVTGPLPQSNVTREIWIGFPLWLPAAGFALLPVAPLYRRLRPRHPHGHCRRCGYDLTGNVSGVCPECGESIGTAMP